MPEGNDRALGVTRTVFYSLMSISQGRSKPSVCARRGLGAVFIFQTMLQDERRPPAPVPRGGASLARGAPPGRAVSRVLETLSNASVGFGIFLFRGFLLFWLWFRFWVFVWFDLVCFFLPCFVSEQKGSEAFQPGHGGWVTGGAAKAGVCSTEGGLHPGGPSTLSRPPTRDKLPVPQSPSRAPRTPPSGKGRGSFLHPRCQIPAVQPWPSPLSGPTAPGARRCTKPRVRGSLPGMRASTRRGSSAAARRVRESAGRKLPTAPVLLLPGTGASPFSPGRQAGFFYELELPSPHLGQSLVSSSF